MQRVEPADWRACVVASMGDGYAQFVTLMGVEFDGPELWLRLRRGDTDELVLTTTAAGAIDSIIDLLPQAAWYEREIAEMFGVDFRGHDTAPLLLAAGSGAPMRRDAALDARQTTAWPGEKEPGGAVARRRQLPPGVLP